ncbi:MAG: M16 family metallopeptidase [Hyphomicrobiaceae bacterium]
MTTPRVTTLANGLRVVTHHMPHLETVSLGVWVATGARHEQPHEHGISHLLEHMAFKGTKTRSALQIAEEIEQVGGDLNAATSLETTAYYARVLKGDDRLALNVLSDILLNATFDEDELLREKDVILQEIAGSQDSPEDVVYDLVQEAAYPGQAVGRTILGTPDSVTSLTTDDLRGFLAKHYGPQNLVVSAAGTVSHDAICEQAAELFGAMPQSNPRERLSAIYHGGARAWDRGFEQSHVVIGFDSPSVHEDGFYAAQVFSGLFGGGMSSRLFQEIRENRGLCYSIYSSAWGLSDSGMFTIYAGTANEMVSELVHVVSGELEKVAENGVSEKEIRRAKAQMKAGLLMSLESSSARAEQMARHLLIYGKLRSSEELIANVDSVTEQSVQAFARRLMAAAPSVGVVGAGAKSRDFADKAELVFAA